MLDVTTIALLIAKIASIGVAITTLEDMNCGFLFKSKELLSWRVFQTSYKSWPLVVKKLAQVFFQEKSWKLILIIRLLCCFGIIFWPFLWASHLYVMASLCGILTITNILFSLRSPYGLDGAHQMNFIIFLTLTISYLAETQTFGLSIGFWFLASQLTLSYFISGIFKMFSSAWVSGKGLQGVFWTSSYGSPFLYHFLSKYSALSKILSWYVILFETFFFVIFFVDSELAIAFLILGILLHLGIAIFMGLNNFLFAFPATYPAMFYCLFIHE